MRFSFWTTESSLEAVIISRPKVFSRPATLDLNIFKKKKREGKKADYFGLNIYFKSNVPFLFSFIILKLLRMSLLE